MKENNTKRTLPEPKICKVLLRYTELTPRQQNVFMSDLNNYLRASINERKAYRNSWKEHVLRAKQAERLAEASQVTSPAEPEPSLATIGSAKARRPLNANTPG